MKSIRVVLSAFLFFGGAAFLFSMWCCPSFQMAGDCCGETCTSHFSQETSQVASAVLQSTPTLPFLFEEETSFVETDLVSQPLTPRKERVPHETVARYVLYETYLI
ncbi:MAG: hypothetical protein HY590_02575 [Candidatus Omnitrophica bacterium]|nr:hypothetical protein [Candidatus Omnitrophota bacterium]